MKEFQRGQRIRTASGGELEVIQKLGEGGQGIVYKVNYNGKQLALKWYFANKLRDADTFTAIFRITSNREFRHELFFGRLKSRNTMKVALAI